jgi:hypothetical protein
MYDSAYVSLILNSSKSLYFVVGTVHVDKNPLLKTVEQPVNGDYVRSPFRLHLGLHTFYFFT